MIPSKFEWKQPIGGIELQWNPLKVQDELDITAANSRQELRHLLSPLLYLRRITKYGTKDQCSLSDLRSWDAYDFQAFMEEVDIREAQRIATLRKSQNPGSPVIELEKAVDEAQIAANRLSVSLRAVLEAAKAAEASPAPLV